MLVKFLGQKCAIFLIFQKFTFLRLCIGISCIHNIRTSKALDGSIGKLQCAEYGRKAAFLLSNTIAAKNAHFFEF